VVSRPPHVVISTSGGLQPALVLFTPKLPPANRRAIGVLPATVTEIEADPVTA
jgi:hypothetical protein